MASESSSAVLDLNDDVTEDTDAPSLSIMDGQDGEPLIMEHGYDIAVKVDAPMKQLSTLETFVTYRVRCVCARWQTPPHVRRRYNHFKLLHKRLRLAHPLTAPPALPPLHSARQQLDRYSPTFVAIRTLALHAFLNRVAKHPIMTHSEDFRLFLTTPDEELDKVFRSENSALNLWGLSSALYSVGGSETKPVANGARVKDPEFVAAADYLQSLQQKLTTLCSLTNKLYKQHAGLATEYVALKQLCGGWCVGAGAVGAGAGCGGGVRGGLRAAAALPALATTANCHLANIRNRDAMHAAYVAGNRTSDDLHNKLEQASEALRSELADWIPKTREEVKSLLLELADNQVQFYTQRLMGWENALKMASQTNMEEVFKTVSKSAVQNLSPSKCKGENSETDFDDIEIGSNDSDFKIQDSDEKLQEFESGSDVVVKSSVENVEESVGTDNGLKNEQSKDSESITTDKDRTTDILQELSEEDLSL